MTLLRITLWCCYWFWFVVSLAGYNVKIVNLQPNGRFPPHSAEIEFVCIHDCFRCCEEIMRNRAARTRTSELRSEVLVLAARLVLGNLFVPSFLKSFKPSGLAIWCSYIKFIRRRRNSTECANKLHNYKNVLVFSLWRNSSFNAIMIDNTFTRIGFFVGGVLCISVKDLTLPPSKLRGPVI